MPAFFMSDTNHEQNRIKDAFLEKLGATGNVTGAARDCGIHRSTVYSWRAHDAAFAAGWDEALAIATDNLAYEARRRALDGIEEVRYFKGEPVGTARRYSDQLLMFLLRAYRPDVYREPRQASRQSREGIEKARDALSRKMEKLAGEDDSGKAAGTDRKPDRDGD